YEYPIGCRIETAGISCRMKERGGGGQLFSVPAPGSPGERRETMDGVESSMQRSSTYAVSRSVLADQIYNALLQWLMDGRLQPGDRVSIDGMAREFNVSPTPVREALARLESTGMVAREAMR